MVEVYGCIGAQVAASEVGEKEVIQRVLAESKVLRAVTRVWSASNMGIGLKKQIQSKFQVIVQTVTSGICNFFIVATQKKNIYFQAAQLILYMQ